MDRGSFCAHAMRLVAHCMNAARINPAVIEVEKRAHRDRIINRFIRIACRMQRADIARLNRDRIAIHFVNKTEEGFFLFR